MHTRVVEGVAYRVRLRKEFAILITPLSVRRLVLAALQAVVPPLVPVLLFVFVQCGRERVRGLVVFVQPLVEGLCAAHLFLRGELLLGGVLQARGLRDGLVDGALQARARARELAAPARAEVAADALRRLAPPRHIVFGALRLPVAAVLEEERRDARADRRHDAEADPRLRLAVPRPLAPRALLGAHERRMVLRVVSLGAQALGHVPVHLAAGEDSHAGG